MFSWSSKKQDIVAQSIAKAEFIAAITTMNQTLWLQKILYDLHMVEKEITKILVDNQAAITISHNPIFHGKTKLLWSQDCDRVTGRLTVKSPCKEWCLPDLFPL
jgi:hypothetical protein